MSLAEKINQKNISEILHFTMDDNLIGIVANGCVLSRKELDSKHIKYKSLELVNDIVWTDRSRDAEWTTHINLSIESINEFLLNRARAKYPENRWFILSFAPEILTHEEVYFTTTNNAYIPHVKRGKGCDGFDLPFTRKYLDRMGYSHTRKASLEERFPSSQQAEALYFSKLSLEHLRKIYVMDDDSYYHATNVIGSSTFFESCPALNIQIEVAPMKFKSNANQEVY